jgi:Mrp family chromosome partitioning ATPase
LKQDVNAVINKQPISDASQEASDGFNVSLETISEDHKIKHVIAVLSGKGGVGKSLVTGLLAVVLRRQGLRVGVLDGDLTCPSIADMFGAQRRLSLNDRGEIEPIESNGGIKIISMNMLLENESDPLVWRGPMVSSAFKQFYSEVDWGQLDYLLVDVPPGTSDVPMTVLQSLPLDGVIIVSSPQMLARKIVKKSINMVYQLKGRIIGVVENMSLFVSPSGEYCEIFGPSSGAELAAITGAPLLAQLPIDPKLAALCDAGQIEAYHAQTFDTLTTNFTKTLQINR